MTLPSAHAAAAMIVAMLTFWLFANGRVKIELVSLVLIAVIAIGLYFFPIEQDGASAGLEVAFGGFGHEALIAICCLMILGRGLVVTGALEPAARILTRLWKFNRLVGLLFSLVLGGAMSMFVNDTPVLVLTMPIMLNLAVRAGVPASKTLMPMNCAILIGGMATTIGTSTNLLVVSIAEDMGLPRFGIFHFADVALIGALVALPYLWLVMPRLLPANSAAEEARSRIFDASLFVTGKSAVLGLSPVALVQKLGEASLSGIERHGTSRHDPDIALTSGDVVHVKGTGSQLREVSDELRVLLAQPAILETAREFGAGDDEIMAELAIGADSALIGQTAKGAQIADRYGVVVIGLYQPARTLLHGNRPAGDVPLEIGDVLLVQGTQAALRQLQIGEQAMVLEGAAEMPRSAKANLALLIFAVVVAAAALHLVPIVISALAGTIAMLATGCVKFGRLGRALSAKVIVLVAASIALGRVLLETGAAHWLGGALALMLRDVPPAAVLAAVMSFAALLTNFSSNTAAAAVGTPIAVSLARQMDVSAEPLVLAVLFGCNLCYATPVAYQTNILIMSAGGYHFRDYVRAGLPLVLIMVVTLSILLVWRYQL